MATITWNEHNAPVTLTATLSDSVKHYTDLLAKSVTMSIIGTTREREIATTDIELYTKQISDAVNQYNKRNFSGMAKNADGSNDWTIPYTRKYACDIQIDRFTCEARVTIWEKYSLCTACVDTIRDKAKLDVLYSSMRAHGEAMATKVSDEVGLIGAKKTAFLLDEIVQDTIGTTVNGKPAHACKRQIVEWARHMSVESPVYYADIAKDDKNSLKKELARILYSIANEKEYTRFDSNEKAKQAKEELIPVSGKPWVYTVKFATEKTATTKTAEKTAKTAKKTA